MQAYTVGQTKDKPPDYGPFDRTIIGRLPRRLRRGRWFVAWRWEWRAGSDGQEGQWTKVPVNPHTGGRAVSTKSATWGTITEAIAHAVQYGMPGIGIMFQGSGLFGIDLDTCVDPRTGEFAPWAAAIVARFPGAWREKSPSRTGIHLIGEGRLPGKGHNLRRPEGGGVECYDAGRFFTLTGDGLPGSPPEPGDSQEAVTPWYLETFGTQTPRPEHRPPAQAPSLTDAESTRLEVARQAKNGAKFVQLYDRGDWRGAGFGSASQADQSLCNALAFYLDNDPSRIDQAFRASALYRPKWDRPDYSGETIRKAIARTTETYQPPSGIDLGGTAAHAAPRRRDPLGTLRRAGQEVTRWLA
jgi:putative DNA primase/helicase